MSMNAHVRKGSARCSEKTTLEKQGRGKRDCAWGVFHANYRECTANYH